jgi:hypothetical protein
VTDKKIDGERTLTWHPYHARLNFEFEIVDGEMTEYLVQLEYNAGDFVEADRKQAARSDTAHSYYHIDFHFVNGQKVQRRESLPQNLPCYKEFRSAKHLFINNEYEILRRLGYV